MSTLGTILLSVYGVGWLIAVRVVGANVFYDKHGYYAAWKNDPRRLGIDKPIQPDSLLWALLVGVLYGWLWPIYWTGVIIAMLYQNRPLKNKVAHRIAKILFG